MSFEIKINNEQLILKLSGNVDLTETSDIKDALKNEPKAGFNSLAVDAGSIDYMDSSAVALLIFSKRVAEENQMRFEITSTSEACTKIIKLAGLDAMFNLPVVTGNNAILSEDVAVQDENNDIKVDLSVENVEADESDFNLGSFDDTEEDLEIDFSAEPNEVESHDTVDNQQESKENQTKDIGSGQQDNSESDDFEFKPGTFE